MQHKPRKANFLLKAVTALPTRQRVNARELLEGIIELDRQGLYGLAGGAMQAFTKSFVLSKDNSTSVENSRLANLSPYVISQNDYIKCPFNLDLFSDMIAFSVLHTACVETICHDLVGNGYYLDSKASEQEQQEITTWLDNINWEGENITDVLYKMMYCECVMGVSACEVVADILDTTIMELNYIDAWKAKPHRTCFMKNSTYPLFQYYEGSKYKPLYFKKFGEKEEWDYLTGEKAILGKSQNYATELAWFINYYPTLGKYWGLPKLVAGWSTTEAFNRQRTYNLSWFETMGVKFALLIRGNLDDEGKQYIDDYLEAEATGSALKTLLLYDRSKTVDFDLKPIQMNATEASFTALNDQCTREIGMLWRVPLFRVGASLDVGALGGNYVRESMSIYQTAVLMRKQQRMEQFITKMIERKFGATDTKFYLNTIDNSDPQLMQIKCDNAYRNGTLTRRQYNELLGLPGFDVEDVDADRYYIQQGLVPLELSGQVPDVNSMLKMIELESSINYKQSSKE